MTDPKMSFEDILDELMLEEPTPSYAALLRWQERYPRYFKTDHRRRMSACN